MDMKRIFGVYLQAMFYVIAGINHFVNPNFYFGLIPDYLPFPIAINTVAGIAEVLFGVLLLVRKTRTLAVYGIIAMLIAFIPSHIYFIQIGACVDDALCTPEWVAWARLVLIHPLLLYWAWMARND